MTQSSQPDPSHPEAVPRALLAGLGLALVVAGQFVLNVVAQDTAYGLPWGLALSGVGMVLFVWASVWRLPTWVTSRIARWRLSPPLLWGGAAILLSILTTVASVALEDFGQTNFLPVTFLWLGAGVCYLVAVAWNQPLGDWRRWLHAHRAELMVVGLITLGAGALRFYQLGALPRVINGDEGFMGQAALLTDRLPLANPFALWANFGAIYLQLMNLAFRLFGLTPFALRLLPAVGGSLAIPALYGLARRLFGLRTALLAATLLAVSHLHLQFSRTVAVGYIQDTLLIPLELYCLISGLEDRNPVRTAIGGLILGLHFSFYLGAEVAAAYILAYLLVAAVICRPLVQNALRPTLVFGGGAVVIALPVAVYSWRHPAEFLARLNADGTFQSGWLSLTMSETGQNAVQVLAGRVAHAFLSLIYYPAIDFYGSPYPPLSLITAALFLVGLGLALWRTRQSHYLLLNGYFWSITLAIGIFSVPPTADSYRMLMALPAALLLAALGLEQLLDLATLKSPQHRLLRAGIAGFILSGLASINVWTYYGDFAGRCRYGNDPQTRFASYLGNYLGSLDRATNVYLLSDDVFRYGTHSSVDFLSHNLPVTNVPAPAATLSPPPQSVIIAPPSRAAELQLWTVQHPGGRLQREDDCANLMMLIYQFP